MKNAFVGASLEGKSEGFWVLIGFHFNFWLLIWAWFFMIFHDYVNKKYSKLSVENLNFNKKRKKKLI